jgi:hypothetical protein
MILQLGANTSSSQEKLASYEEYVDGMEMLKCILKIKICGYGLDTALRIVFGGGLL